MRTFLPSLRAGAFYTILFAMFCATGLGRAWAFDVSAPIALLVDENTGSVLFEKDAEKSAPPGYLAKVMTATIVFQALKDGRISLDTPFIVSVDAWRRGGGPARKAAMFAEVNKPVRVEDLLAGALVVSGNDAALTLAEGLAGSEEAFVQRMNEVARTLGMEHTHFFNATGYDTPEQLSTARDMAILARHVISAYPAFYPFFSRGEIHWNRIRQRNRNPLMRADIGADGLQAGWVEGGGYNLLGSAQRNGRRLIVVVLGAEDERMALSDARGLLEWGFDSFTVQQIFPAGARIGVAQVFGGRENGVPLAAQGSVHVLAARHGRKDISARVIYVGPVRAPVVKGQQVARLEISRAGGKVQDVPLYTAGDVPMGSLWQRAIDGVRALVGDATRSVGRKIRAAVQ
ncbi:D-alanyl-D-alanine carboxypeptidase family protein [Xanthobacter sp. TB0139]|uniref:D-alanyl-D-alanine carboxypeptidase family protein n=1 Tax=Xanthobacter sp. TB0139 TaxID=3459178 RepID=UPI004039AA10